MDKVFSKEFEYCRKAKDKFDGIIKPILTKHPVSHVWVSKFYYDGRYIDLGNDLDWKEQLLEAEHFHDLRGIWSNQYQSIGNGVGLTNWNCKDKVVCCELEENLASPQLKLCKSFNIKSTFNIFVFHKDHLENYGFGSPLSREEFTCLTRREQGSFLLLASYLKERAEPLFKPQQDVYGFCEYPDLPPSHVYSKDDLIMPSRFPMGEHYLTPREIQYFSHLASGKSVKEVAIALDVSPRTIESAVSVVRERFDCPSRGEVVKIFNEAPLLKNLPPGFLQQVFTEGNPSPARLA